MNCGLKQWQWPDRLKCKNWTCRYFVSCLFAMSSSRLIATTALDFDQMRQKKQLDDYFYLIVLFEKEQCMRLCAQRHLYLHGAPMFTTCTGYLNNDGTSVSVMDGRLLSFIYHSVSGGCMLLRAVSLSWVGLERTRITPQAGGSEERYGETKL